MNKPLLSKFKLDGKVWLIQYEGLRMLCFTCGKVGHHSSTCVSVQSPEKSTEENPPSTGGVEDSRFGECIVKMPNRRQATNQKKVSPVNEGRMSTSVGTRVPAVSVPDLRVDDTVLAQKDLANMQDVSK